MSKNLDTSIHQPHDGLFKLSLKRKAAAHDFLQCYLSDEVLAKVDLGTLDLKDTVFASRDYTRYASDVVYGVQTKHGLGYFLLLLEHQSEEDKDMSLRLLEYNVQLMRQHVDQHGGKLPEIYTIVFYTGTPSYKGPQCLDDAFEKAGALKRMGAYRFLVDLARKSNADILQDGEVALMELTLKEGRKDPCKFLREGGKIVQDLINTSPDGNPVCQYLLEHEKHSKDTLMEEMRKLNPERQAYIMTAVQQIEQQGIQQGKHERELDIARKMRKLGATAEFITKATGLEPKDLGPKS